jgi:O-antigen ligase
MKLRPLIIFLCAVIALCGSAVAVATTQHHQAFELRGYADATTAEPLPYRLPLLGVNADLTQYGDDLPAQFAAMRAAHIHWVRQMVYWSPSFDWTMWDAIMAALRQYNGELALVPVLMADAPPLTDDARAAFAAWAAAFAARYADDLRVYQVWDEPNLRAAWGNRDPRPIEYAALLGAVAPSVRAADADAVILAAALAPTVEQGPQNLSDWLYLRGLYAQGAQQYWDAVAAKPYGFAVPALERTVREDTLNFSRAVALREIMLQNGEGGKALWAVNWGWNSLPADWQGAPSIWGAVTADQQRQYTLQALDRAEREWPWLGGMILYTWQPAAPATDPVWGFALRTPDGAPTPLYEALVNRPQHNTAINGRYPAANPHASYSGLWTFGPLGADIGWVRPTDSRLSFAFHGSDVALIVRQDNYVAYLYPTINDQPANALPRDGDGNAYVVLTSGNREPETQVIPLARGLPLGDHTLRVVADRGEDRWALIGYAVSAGDMRAPWRNMLNMAWLALAVSALASIITAWAVDWRALFPPLTAAVTRVWRGVGGVAQLGISAVTSLALMLGLLLTWGEAAPNLFRRDLPSLALMVLSAGLVSLELHVILTVIALVVLFIIIYNRVDLGLMLTVFYAPFFLFPIELYRFAFPMSELVILLTAAAAALRGMAAYGRARRDGTAQPVVWMWARWQRLNALDWVVIAWVALGVLSLLWTERPRAALTELRTMIVEPALFYLIARSANLDRAAWLRLVDALIVAGVAVAGIGLLLYVRGDAIITAEEGARRLASVYGSPNNVGLFLGRCLPLALAMALLPLDRGRRAGMGGGLVLMLLAVGLSQSAGALLLGVPFGVAFVLVALYGRRGLLLIAGAAAVAVPLVAVLIQQSERFARLLDLSSGTNFFRLRVWQSAINILQERPLTGLGLDQFLYAFRGKYILPDAWQEPNLSHPHNFVLDVWLRLGVAGVLWFAWAQWAFWRAWRAALAAQSDPLWRAVVVGAGGAMANLLAHGLIDNSIFVQDLCYVFVLLLLLAGYTAQPSDAAPHDTTAR